MTNFFDFCNEKTNTNQTKSDEKQYENIINEYSSCSKDDLTKKLFEEVEKKKKEGDFDIEKIKNTINGARALLNEDQNAMLDSLLKKMS